MNKIGISKLFEEKGEVAQQKEATKRIEKIAKKAYTGFPEEIEIPIPKKDRNPDSSP